MKDKAMQSSSILMEGIHHHFSHVYNPERNLSKRKQYSMADPLEKTGRGGAGNYWPKKELGEAAKAGPDEVRPHLSHCARLVFATQL